MRETGVGPVVELRDEQDVLSMWALLDHRFASTIARHHEGPESGDQFSIRRLINGTCPHIRDHIRRQHFRNYGADLTLPVTVYLHANAPHNRYCINCSFRAHRDFGDGVVCATCHRLEVRFTHELRHAEDAVGSFICVVPLCEPCNAIVGPTLAPVSVETPKVA
jgi:hypothetical protein